MSDTSMAACQSNAPAHPMTHNERPSSLTVTQMIRADCLSLKPHHISRARSCLLLQLMMSPHQFSLSLLGIQLTKQQWRRNWGGGSGGSMNRGGNELGGCNPHESGNRQIFQAAGSDRR